jgi:hypothetical protein
MTYLGHELAFERFVSYCTLGKSHRGLAPVNVGLELKGETVQMFSPCGG